MCHGATCAHKGVQQEDTMLCTLGHHALHANERKGIIFSEDVSDHASPPLPPVIITSLLYPPSSSPRQTRHRLIHLDAS